MSPLRKKRLILWSLIALVIILGGAATIYRNFFVRLVRVPTGAMMNTILIGDYLSVHRLFGPVERGRIVVFQFPGDSNHYVSRVVGLPGETIQLRGKTIYINDRALEEQRVMARDGRDLRDPLVELSTEGSGPYRVFYMQHAQDFPAESDGDFGVSTPFQIPSDNFFLMGDNRDNSEDSRYRGPVPSQLIWGEARLVLYSIEEKPGGEVRWDRMFKKLN